MLNRSRTLLTIFLTSERLPLLQRNTPGTTPFDLPNPQPAPGPSTISFPTAHPANGSPDVTITSRFNTFGWTEHALPNSLSYFSHAALRVVTDVDLRRPVMLDAITAYLDRNDLFGDRDDMTLPPSGWELWVREPSKQKAAKGRKANHTFTKCWINHTERTLSLDPPSLSPSRDVAVGAIAVSTAVTGDDSA